jgi:regulator of protease activity HflC (stomatin/prohibitin superfamily)
MTRNKTLFIAAAVGALLAWLSLYTVSETQFALITQFGRPVRTVTQAGLHAKWFFQSALRFDKRLRIYNPAPLPTERRGCSLGGDAPARHHLVRPVGCLWQ